VAEKGIVIVIRHAESKYPADLLSDTGIAHAREVRDRLLRPVNAVFSSPQTRAIDTANLLVTGSKPRVDVRFQELEIPTINCPTPRAYVEAAHQKVPELVNQKGLEMAQAIADLAVRGGTTLIVSHNLAISALNQQLTGRPSPVENLEGLKLEIGSGGLLQVLGKVIFRR